MKDKITIAIPHSNTWFLTQTCIAALKKHLTPEYTDRFDFEIIIIDNSWDNSPSIYGITKTRLGEGVKVINNNAVSYCHSAALDQAFKASWPMKYFIPMDSDVIIRKPNWLDEFLTRLMPTDYAVGDWHQHEWVYPSFALYRGEVIKAMADVSESNFFDENFRWGENFENADPIPTGHLQMLQGPFSNRRGWPQGTVLKQRPFFQADSPGRYEPGQQFHHWAVQAGHTYSRCPCITIFSPERNAPLGTFYGIDPAIPTNYNEAVHNCWAVHWWAGTRAVDYINPRAGHPLEDPAILFNMPYWLERESRWWLHEVPEDIRTETLKLIKEHGWMFDRKPYMPADGVEKITQWYQNGGVRFE